MGARVHARLLSQRLLQTPCHPTTRPPSPPLLAPCPRLSVCGPATRGIGLARVGQDTAVILSGTLAELARVDFGPPLHSLVLVGPALHDLEKDLFEHFRVKGDEPAWVPPAPPANPNLQPDADADDADGDR